MTHRAKKKVLLSGVFGPFGVDDEFGRKENIMELFHNQVTRGQGIASFRFHHRSFGLYFIAENIDADVTVLDFPTRRQFEREVKKGYDVVGISFIMPNFVKAREMARVTRKHAPGSVIVLGGHGAAIEGIEDRIQCDHVVKGEGIRWMRAYLGQDPDAPIHHPTLPSTERQSIYGVPVPGTPATLLVPGVGCVNGCSFCSTSHFFGKCYTPFLSTGREIFDTCCRLADETGTDQFFVMDENFLKDTQRARDLLALMEKHQRWFRFEIFSSAEAITAFGVENMVRMGVEFVWIGVESGSTKGNFEKNRGIDPKVLVREMRKRGIIVLASGILCQEHHTQENIHDDIDFMIDLNADFVQFMLLTPLPVTGLYRSHKKRGILDEDLAFEDWHGQTYLAYRHPEFPGDSAKRWIDLAFEEEHQANVSSMYRVVKTTFDGWTRLRDADRDACLDRRMSQLENRLRLWMSMLPTIVRNPANEREKWLAQKLDQRIGHAMRPNAQQLVMRALTPVASALWKARVAIKGDMIQPPTLVTKYAGSRRNRRPKEMIAEVVEFPRIAEKLDEAAAAAVMVEAPHTV